MTSLSKVSFLLWGFAVVAGAAQHGVHARQAAP